MACIVTELFYYLNKSSISKEVAPILESLKELSEFVADNTINIHSTDEEYSHLSNFNAGPVKYANFEYPTIEHAYQAAKVMFLGAKPWAIQFLQNPEKSKTGNIARGIGQSLKLKPNTISQEEWVSRLNNWDNIKNKVMEDLLEEYYFTNSEAQKELLNTGNAYITHNSKVSSKTDEWTYKFPNMLMKVRNKLNSKNKENFYEVEAKKVTNKISIAQFLTDYILFKREARLEHRAISVEDEAKLLFKEKFKNLSGRKNMLTAKKLKAMANGIITLDINVFLAAKETMEELEQREDFAGQFDVETVWDMNKQAENDADILRNCK